MGSVRFLANEGDYIAVANWMMERGSVLTSHMDRAEFERLCAVDLPLLTGHSSMFAALSGRSGLRATWNFGCSDALYKVLVGAWTGSRVPPNPAGNGLCESAWLQSLGCLRDDQKDAQAVVLFDGVTTSAVLLMGLPKSTEPRKDASLRLVAPFLHIAMARLSHIRAGLTNAPKLTRRERELLTLVAQGHSNPQIAVEWSRSVATVRNQMHHLMQKLGVGSRAQLVSLAIASGLLELARVTPLP
jgi:DNA-binding CsgD family transcriptional regulator